MPRRWLSTICGPKRNSSTAISLIAAEPNDGMSSNAILHIGKEANKWEEQYFLGLDDDAEIEYGVGQTFDALDVRPTRALPRTR